MYNFNFEGDVHGASQPQLDFISKVLDKKGFKNPKVIMEPVGKVGENYMANVKRIVVKENGETFKMIAKLASENPVMREMSNIGIMFQNEHYMYTEVLPKLDQKQKTAGVPENERFKFAKCYGSYNEAPNEILLLEDLKESKFEIMNRFEPLPHEHVKMVLKNFAIYHALSFAIRYQEPETFANFQKQLGPNLEPNGFNEQALMFFNRLEEQMIEIADDRCKQVLKGMVVNSDKYDAKTRKFAKESKHTVIQQGDGWTNNIMFRFENNAPVECVLVDYQLSKENSPVFDLIYMLFNSTTHKQRLQHYYEYIDYYHTELDNALHNFGLKANFVYPREKLDAEIKIYGKQLFATTLIMSSIVTKTAKEAGKMREVMEWTDLNDAEKALDYMMEREPKSLEMFRNRVEDLADSFTEFGLV